MQWYWQVLRQYAVFGGRASRKEYWMFTLFNFIISWAIGLVFAFLEGMLGLSGSLSNTMMTVYTFAILVPSIAVGVRRMHDTGRSGWWLLLPLINFLFLCSDSQADENAYGRNPKVT